MTALPLVVLLLATTPCAEHRHWTARIEARPSAPVVGDPGRLAAILARPEFGSRREDPELWLRILAWLRDWLGSLLETRGMQRFASSTRVIVLIAAAAAFVFGAWRWLLRRRTTPSASSDAGRAPTAERLSLDAPAAHLERARELLTRAPRDAIREGLLALLSSLERVRLAQPDRVKTNRELAAELVRRGAPPSVADPVGRLLAWYDGAFYSLEPVPPPDAARFLDEVAGLGQSLERAR